MMQERTAEKRRTLWRILLALNVAFIWGNSLLPPEKSWLVSEAVKNLFLLLLPAGSGDAGDGIGLLGVLVRKAAHFTEFCVLGCLLRLCWGRIRSGWERSLFMALAIAMIDETIQAFTGRTSSVFDVWLDFSGAAVGAILLYGLAQCVFHRKRVE